MEIKNIIFDWSGVIQDDFTQAYEACMYIFKKLGTDKMTKEEFRDAFFLPYMDFYKKYIPNTTKEQVDSLFLEALKVVTKPTVYSGVKEILTELKKKNVKMYIISTHPQKAIEEEIKEYEIENIFEKIYGSVNDKKQRLKDVINDNNLDLDSTIFVGDMIHDIEAAKDANIKCVAVTYGYDSKKKLKEKNPEFIFDKFEEINNLIK